MNLSINWIGWTAALVTFIGIWFGHVAVRKIESISPTIWLPSIAALLLGCLFELGALLSENMHLSAALGIFGITLLWDALEFWRQEHRIKKGHAPANPANPRHMRILEESEKATTLDWLKREPAGRPFIPDELPGFQGGAR
jgi:hypothetical protein